MQIMIEIDKDITESLNDGDGLTDCQYKSLVDAITNGTPLPKGHGRIIDESEIDWLADSSSKKFTFEERIKNTSPTIIEADKVER